MSIFYNLFYCFNSFKTVLSVHIYVSVNGTFVLNLIYFFTSQSMSYLDCGSILYLPKSVIPHQSLGLYHVYGITLPNRQIQFRSFNFEVPNIQDLSTGLSAKALGLNSIVIPWAYSCAVGDAYLVNVWRITNNGEAKKYLDGFSVKKQVSIDFDSFVFLFNSS